MLKRLLDLVTATILIILLGPVLLTSALLVRLGSQGPIFYKARRVGLHEQEFHMFKFRTMVANAATIGPYLTQENDPRITRVGFVLRRTSVDELPQLLNVISGHMSLVGPRPETPELVKGYDQRQRQVFNVRPGITGLTQINGRASIPMDKKLDMELDYVRRHSLLRDLIILARTPVAVISNRGNLI